MRDVDNGVNSGVQFRPGAVTSPRARRTMLEKEFRKVKERPSRRGNGQRWCSVRFPRGKATTWLFERLLISQQRKRVKPSVGVRKRIWRRRSS